MVTYADCRAPRLFVIRDSTEKNFRVTPTFDTFEHLPLAPPTRNQTLHHCKATLPTERRNATQLNRTLLHPRGVRQALYSIVSAINTG